MSKISVCIPTFNQENYISDAINGVLMQKNCDYEIIIANDGSTDKTKEICESFKSKFPDKIKLINQSQNKGIIENTKDCLLNATGDYIAICEGDDYWIDEYKLYKQVNILEEDTTISLVHTLWKNLDTSNDTTYDAQWIERNYISESGFGLESFKEILFSQHRGIRFSSVLFRKSDFYKILKLYPDFFSKDFSTLDLGVFFAFSYLGKHYPLKDISTVYRIHDGSVSINSNKKKQIYYALGVLYIQCYFINEIVKNKSFIQKFIRSNIGSILDYALHTEDKIINKKIFNLINKYNYRAPLTHKMCLEGIKKSMLKKIMKIIISIKNRMR